MPKPLKILLGIVVLVASAALLYRLMYLQYESGDAYPRYSSHRADPLGTLALYLALDTMDGVNAERNTEDLTKLNPDADTTLLLTGAVPGPDPEALIEMLEEFVESGGRLVVAFQRESFWTTGDESDEESEDGESDEERSDDEADDNEDADEDEADGEAPPDFIDTWVDLTERWGFEYTDANLSRDDAGRSLQDASRGDVNLPALPERLRWHSDLAFTYEDDTWRTIYKVGSMAVLMRRTMGEGEIVLMSDNYTLTNESVMRDRQSELLAWMMGDSTRVVFDETHLGIQQDPGIMSLMLRYRLGPTLIALGIVLLLFIWRNAGRVLPGQFVVEEEAETMNEFGAVEGLSRLARRSVRRKDLLQTCWDLHASAHRIQKPLSESAEARIRQELNRIQEDNAKNASIVSAYNTITKIINERKRAS